MQMLVFKRTWNLRRHMQDAHSNIETPDSANENNETAHFLSDHNYSAASSNETVKNFLAFFQSLP